jgi:hypothetical protein
VYVFGGGGGSYDGSCSVKSLAVWDLGKFKCLMFVAKRTSVR